jgi:protein arginine N-methyltransferase 7
MHISINIIHIYFQAFKPMAECASKIIAQNGFADKIKLVPKRSTDLVVGEGM